MPKVSQKKDKKISISHLAFGAIDIYNRLVVDKCYCGRSQFASCWEFYEKSKYITKQDIKSTTNRAGSVALAVKSIIRMISKFVF